MEYGRNECKENEVPPLLSRMYSHHVVCRKHHVTARNGNSSKTNAMSAWDVSSPMQQHRVDTKQ